MRLNLADIRDFPEYNISLEAEMGHAVVDDKSPLSERLIAAWLKYDPFVKLIARDEQARFEAMFALAGEKAATRHFGKYPHHKPAKLIYPKDIRHKEQEFLRYPEKRTLIIRELVFWGTNKTLNEENPDSYHTRMQVISSLLGPIFINSNETQERLIIEGVKVLVLSRETSLGRHGEPSALVHNHLLTKVTELLRYHQAVKSGQHDRKTDAAFRAELLKTIQNFRESGTRSAYYVADDLKTKKRTLAQKFPLKVGTLDEILKIVQHYTFSAWPEARSRAVRLFAEFGTS